MTALRPCILVCLIADGVLTASSPPNEDGFSDKLSTTPTSTDSSSPSPSPGFTVNHSKVCTSLSSVKQMQGIR